MADPESHEPLRRCARRPAVRRPGAARGLVAAALGDPRSVAIKLLAATCYSRLALLERSLDEPLPELESPLELEFGLLTPAEAE